MRCQRINAKGMFLEKHFYYSTTSKRGNQANEPWSPPGYAEVEYNCVRDSQFDFPAGVLSYQILLSIMSLSGKHSMRRCIAAALTSFGIWILCGCNESSPPTGPSDSTADLLTFNRDIAPIVFQHCASCHRPGQSGPFSLLSYGEVKRRAEQIAEVTGTRYMPPWLLAPDHGRFLGERRLGDDQIERIRQWVEQGAAEGDPADLPTAPTFPEGWQLGQPDLVVEMSPYTLAAEGNDVFRNFVIAIPNTELHHIRAVEIRPSNPKVAHHAIMQIDRSNSSRIKDEQDPGPGYGGMEMSGSAPLGFFLGWTPGKVPFAGTEGVSWPLHPRSDIVLQLHMVPSGKPEIVEARIGFYFADHPPTFFTSGIQMRSLDIDIPPGESEYLAQDAYVLPVDIYALGVYPHAHYVGKRLEGFVEVPDGTRKWLFLINDWDFNWQDQYRLADPLFLPKGSVINMRYHYDNSTNNPRNPSKPPKRVEIGFESTDEMANLFIQVRLQNANDHVILYNDVVKHDTDVHMKYFHQKLITHPDDPKAHSQLSIGYRRQGQMDKSIKHAEKALRAEPDNARFHIKLGRLLITTDRPNEAIDHFRAAIELNPELDYAHRFLADVLKYTGQLDEALKHYERAIEINPESLAAHIKLGKILGIQFGKVDEAIVHFRAAVRIDPESDEAKKNLAYALQIKAGQFKLKNTSEPNNEPK